MLNLKISEVISRPEYDFLGKNEHLQRKNMFVTFGGSHAYGTTTENSDIDIRGCAAAAESDLLGLTSFEQFVDNTTVCAKMI